MAKIDPKVARHEKLRLPPGNDGALWRPRIAGQRRSMHHHDELEFNLVLRGQGCYLFGDRRQDLHPRTLIWLFPRQNHLLLDYSPDFEMWVAVFRPTLVKRLCHETASAVLKRGDPPGHFCREIPPAQCRKLDTLFREVTDLRGDCFNAALGYSLMLTWNMFCRAEDLLPGPQVHPAIQHAARLIRDEQQPSSLNQLARKSGISPWRLSRLFREQTGVSLVAYRQRQRLERFLDLYGDGTTCKMLDAALSAGFGSYPQFHRVFCQIMGVSPAEHRRRLKVAGAQP